MNPDKRGLMVIEIDGVKHGVPAEVGALLQAVSEERDELKSRVAELEVENEILRAECGFRQIQGYWEGMEQAAEIEFTPVCTDPHHDDRWCPHCSSMEDGVDQYQQAIRDRIKKSEPVACEDPVKQDPQSDGEDNY
jgi:hypothetical protein